jgi:hypothetical protein
MSSDSISRSTVKTMSGKELVDRVGVPRVHGRAVLRH